MNKQEKEKLKILVSDAIKAAVADVQDFEKLMGKLYAIQRMVRKGENIE